MKRIKFVARAGPYLPGQFATLADEAAKRLIDAEVAIYAVEPPALKLTPTDDANDGVERSKQRARRKTTAKG